MPSWQDTLIIASGVIKKVYGEKVACNSQPVSVAVWPARQSGGLKATVMAFRSPVDVLMAMNNTVVPLVATSGPNSALFFAGSEYIIPINPGVNTVHFLTPNGNTGPVEVKWYVGRD